MMIWQNAWIVVAVSSSSFSAPDAKAWRVTLCQPFGRHCRLQRLGHIVGEELMHIAMHTRSKRACS